MNNFTDDQLRIINEMDKNMIVSASAGSGKTTVMIERIIKLMVEHQVPISKFLIVTFTKASSSDMKNKLIKKLSEKEPTPFILEQIDNIPISDISNLHSFCARLLKSHFYEVGLDPAFVVLDDIEASALKDRAVDILFKKEYEENPEFYDLIDIFSKNRKDHYLRELILRFDNFLASESEPEKWFQKGLKNYNTDFENNPSAKLLNEYIIKACKALEIECKSLIQELNVVGASKLIEFLQKIDTTLVSVHAASSLEKNSKAIIESEKLGRIPNVDEQFEEYKLKVEAFRDKFAAVIKKLKEIAIKDTDEMREWLSITKKRVVNLYQTVKKFKEIYASLKKEKGGLDFNDLEEYTFQVLQNQDILAELKDKYEYIFVDEYQDINGMQEKIISLLARENNRFMVGDVKQSIYRFRLCDPQIFIDKYSEYNSKANSKVFDLNDNFRSHKEILDFCNYVFSRSMTKDFGGLDYQSKQMKSGLEDWDNKKDGSNINLIYIDTKKEKAEAAAEINNVYSVEKHVNMVSDEEKSSVAEALIVAKNISELMLHGKIYDASTKRHRKIEYKDIVILTASRSEQLKDFIDTLRDLNLPVSADLVSDALDDPFVNAIVNLFKLISNPTHDDKMLNVLYSPLFNVTADELTQITVTCKDDGLSRNVFNIVKNNAFNNDKIHDFVEKFKKYQKLAQYKTVPELLNVIEEDLQILVKIYASGNHEESLVKYNKFKAFLPNVLLNEYLQDLPSSLPIESSSQSNSIRIMTIHKSKGLEFPVVFMIGMGRGFNFKSLFGDCLFSKEMGLGMAYFDEHARYKSDTIAIEAVRISEKEKLLEEQQRLLYVGMTRAINFLYVIGSKDSSKLNEDFVNPTCFLDWFTESLYNNQLSTLNVETFDLKDIYDNKPHVDKNEMIYLDPSQETLDKLKNNFNYKYSFIEDTKLPVKSSFTALSENNNIKNNITVDDQAIQIGNSYHKVMQYISFDATTAEAVKKELDRMYEEGKIDSDTIKLVDPNLIARILSLSLFEKINQDNSKVYREREFYYQMPASIMLNTKTKEKVLMQGIIDLLVIKDDCFDIIDYKTSKLSGYNLINKYRAQLELYSFAMEKAIGKPLGAAYIVSFVTGEVVKIL